MLMDHPIPTYGADESGLICGYQFEPGHDAVALTSDEAQERVSAIRQSTEASDGASPSAFIWLHFNLAHAASVRWMERHAGLSVAFHDALKDDLGSTRIERDEQAL